jgi:hypothetical protein
MTVRLGDDGTILLVGDCPTEDAERLLTELLAHPQATVDWGACTSAHTAVIQVLLASEGPLIGPPQGEFLKAVIEPALDRAHGKIQPSRDA